MKIKDLIFCKVNIDHSTLYKCYIKVGACVYGSTFICIYINMEEIMDGYTPGCFEFTGGAGCICVVGGGDSGCRWV